MPAITVYPIAGRQRGPFSIPHPWCEECKRLRSGAAERE